MEGGPRYPYDDVPPGVTLVWRPSKDDPWACQSCCKTYGSKEGAKKHARTHTPEVKSRTGLIPISAHLKGDHRREQVRKNTAASM
jgi:hypothetical protein